MRLEIVTGPRFTAECVNCHQRKPFGFGSDRPHQEPTLGGFADLDGKAFMDYYCADCAAKLLEGAA